MISCHKEGRNVDGGSTQNVEEFFVIGSIVGIKVIGEISIDDNSINDLSLIQHGECIVERLVDSNFLM